MPGYQYDDNEIVGFSHTHFSGTGHSDLGDFLIMPTVGELQMEPGDKGDPKSGFRSAFSHSTEVAEPDYYKVRLEDDNILAEMTDDDAGRISSIHISRVRRCPHHPRPDARDLQLRRQERLDVCPRRKRSHRRRLSPDQRLGTDADGVFRDGVLKAVRVLRLQEVCKARITRDFGESSTSTKNFPEMAGKQIAGVFRFQDRGERKDQDQICPVAGFDRRSDRKFEI